MHPPLRPGLCWRAEHRFSRFRFPIKVLLAVLGNAGRLQGSACERGFVAVQKLEHSGLDLVASESHLGELASGQVSH